MERAILKKWKPFPRLISQRAKDRADRISRALGDKKFGDEGRSELRTLRLLSVPTRLDGLSEKDRSVALNLLAEAAADLRSDLMETEDDVSRLGIGFEIKEANRRV